MDTTLQFFYEVIFDLDDNDSLIQFHQQNMIHHHQGMIGMGIDRSKQLRDFCMIQNMVKSLGSVIFFRAKKGDTDHLTDHQKNKTPKTLSSRGNIVESEGIEPSSKQVIEELSTCLVFN